MATTDISFWRNKLLAFLHDPPCKPFDIRNHEEIARGFRARAGLRDEEYEVFHHGCDHTAAAADRFPFPRGACRLDGIGCSASFTGGAESPFRHPLGGSNLVWETPLPTGDEAETIFQSMQGSVKVDDLAADRQDWANFFLHWRRWPDEAARHDGRTAYLPADTRIPDHTTWTHMSIVSALHACVDERRQLRPAFLMFHMGPVQGFIAQARKTRDLWAGSYLLSWLVAHAMKAVTDAVGPDNIIFPSLRGQPIFDALHREELYEHGRWHPTDDTTDSTWDRMAYNAAELVTPSLPNRFLAVVPEWRAEELGAAAAEAVRTELRHISGHCWQYLQTEFAAKNEWKARWDAQVERFPEIFWTAVPWQQDIDSAIDLFKDLPAGKYDADGKAPGPAEALRDFKRLAEEWIPEDHRDERCYEKREVGRGLNNRGFTWPANYAACDYALAARRHTRDFPAWDTDDNQTGAVKDALSGKEEVIGDEDWWDKLHDHKSLLFKTAGHSHGAMNLIKRVWGASGYLPERLGVSEPAFRHAVSFDSVPEIAAVGSEMEEEPDRGSGYFAVIAMDGDRMGKWVSGALTPKWAEQLAKGPQKYFSALAGEVDAAGPLLANHRRPLNPSYHLQFSEALSNFSLHLARPIVEEFGGQLIYAGGDDVLAMLPAFAALPCARALRAAFRGEKELTKLVRSGWEVTGDKGGFVKPPGRNTCPLVVPGPRTDVSCGIAIAHVREPLQKVIEEARQAEHRAKDGLKRGAFAVTLYKRGGETVHWGAKWQYESGFEPLRLYEAFQAAAYPTALRDRIQAEPTPPDYFLRLARELPEKALLARKFPYALAQLLRPYMEYDAQGKCITRLGSGDKTIQAQIAQRELAHVMARQAVDGRGEDVAELAELAGKYLAAVAAAGEPADHFHKLFLVAAFMNRKQEDR